MKRFHLRTEFIVLGFGAGFIFLAGILLMFWMYPIHLNSNVVYGQDPAYQYLFAGVDILQGHAPLHTDHPGTPLQSLIAVTIAIVWMLLKLTGFETTGLFDSVLSHPELYLAAISLMLLLLTSIATFYLGRAIFKTTKSYPLALSCQLSPLIFAVVVPNLIYPSPEALLISIVIALLGILTPIIFNSHIEKSVYQKIALPAGLLSGIGLATKITFFPMLGLLVLLKYPKLIIQVFLYTVIGWLLGVLPILERLPNMFFWFYRVLTHTGTHGAGSQGLFNLDQFKMSISWLINHFSLLYFVFLCLILTVIAITVSNLLRHKLLLIKIKSHTVLNTVNWLTPSILSLIVIVQTVMVAKHPGVSYMIPVLPITLISGVWLIYQSDFLEIFCHLKSWLPKIWLLFVVATSGLALNHACTTLINNQIKGKESYTEIRREIEKFDDPLLIGAFNCNFLECAEWFGMLLVPEMELKMGPISPNFYHYDIFSKRLHLPGQGELSEDQTQKTILDLLAQNRVVLLISPEFDQLKRFKLEKISSTSIQNLYRVTGLSNP